MTFVFGVLGALVMILSAAAAFVASFARSFDEKAGREIDEVWFGKLRRRIQLGFWGGLAMTIAAAVVATS